MNEFYLMLIVCLLMAIVVVVILMLGDIHKHIIEDRKRIVKLEFKCKDHGKTETEETKTTEET